ncbi:unnamed protein product, partial [Iphiclides podalirius]
MADCSPTPSPLVVRNQTSELAGDCPSDGRTVDIAGGAPRRAKLNDKLFSHAACALAINKPDRKPAPNWRRGP